MTTGIYKITNLINGKHYIGQSIHIERRWAEHCKPSSSSLIGKAIHKYGKEHFSFSILEQCDKNKLNERENFWIGYYKSMTPYGYNVMVSNETESTAYTYYDAILIEKIINALLHNTNKTLQQIADEYNVSVSMVSRINRGENHFQQGLSYPLFQTTKMIQPKRCVDCGKIITKVSTRCSNCYNKNKSKHLPDRNTLKNLIRKESFVQIGKKYNVSDKAVTKWCKTYGLPYRKKDIKVYTDEQWIEI